MAKTAAKSKSSKAKPATKAKPAAKSAVKKPPAKKTAPKPKPAKKAPAKGKPAVKKAAKPVARKAPAKTPAKSASKSAVAKPAVAKPKSAAKPAPAKKAVERPVAKTAGSGVAKASATAVVARAQPGKAAKPAESMPKPRKRENGTTEVKLPAGYRPSASEEYMSPRQVEYFRLKLLKWREDLVEESKQTIDNLRDEVRDVGDEAERAQRETENSLELRTRDRYRKLISQIDKALKRIEEGEYGYCEETGEPIGIDRLEVRPIARFSIDAQERWELRQKHMGE